MCTLRISLFLSWKSRLTHIMEIFTFSCWFEHKDSDWTPRPHQKNERTIRLRRKRWEELTILFLVKISLELNAVDKAKCLHSLPLNWCLTEFNIDKFPSICFLYYLFGNSVGWSINLLLGSSEFEIILDMSLKTAVDVMMEDISILCGDNYLKSGIPLAKLLPRLAHMSRILLEEPNRDRYIQIVQDMQEVQKFFTLLYASTPAS